MARSPDHEDEALGRLIDEIETRRARGETVAAETLAEDLGLPVEVVHDCLAGLDRIEGALEEPGDDVGHSIAPPELPEDLELIDELGRGGMGIVYRARQHSLDREVAVKVLCPGELVYGEALRRFRRETQALAKLRHPHVVTIHEVGASRGNVWYVMDLFQESLADLLTRNRRPMPLARIVNLMIQVADAVAHVHTHGLIHRDLKPANILLDEQGDAHVADFGLAADPAAGATLTVTGRVLGTPDYMAPEQALGERAQVDERTDVYALGAILYECLTGRTPFANRPLLDKIHAVAHEEPLSPRQYRREVPKALECVCLTAMAKDPEERYSTASALREELVRFRDGLPVVARPPGMGRRATALVKRHRNTLSASAATALALLAAFWIWSAGAAPKAFLATAEELHHAGDAEAAVRYYDRGWEAARDGSGDRVTRFELGYGSIRARLAMRREVEALEEDLDLLGEWAEGDWALEMRHALLVAARANITGSDPAGLSAPLELLRRIPREIRHQGSKQEESFVMAALAPALRVPGDPVFAPAAAVTVALFRMSALEGFFIPGICGPERSGVELYRSHGLPPARILPALIRWRQNLPYDERHTIDSVILMGGFGDFRWAGEERSSLETMLYVMTEDNALPEPTRALAASALAAGCDLPFRLVEGVTRDVSAWDETMAKEVARLWVETRTLDPVEALERKVESAASLLAHVEDLGTAASGYTGDWLRFKTGAYRVHGSSDWLEWLARHQDSGPIEWIAESLELEEDPGEIGIRALTERLLDERDVRTRLRLHVLLSLTHPEPALVPYLPVQHPDLGDPLGLSEQWRALVLSSEVREFTLHSALVIWRDAVGAPELLADGHSPVALGESYEQRLDFELFDPSALGSGPSLLGWRHRVPTLGVGRGSVELGGEIAYGSRGIRGAVQRAEVAWRPNSFWEVSTGASLPPRFSVASVSMLELEDRLTRRPGGNWDVEFHHQGALLLRIEERGGTRDRTWSLGEWIANLHEEVGASLREFDTNPAPDFAPKDVLREDQVRALCYFPGAALSEELASFSGHIETGHSHSSDYERFLLAARLLGGDAGALPPSPWIAEYLESGPWLPFSPTLAASQDPSIRSFAAPHVAGIGGDRATTSELKRIARFWGAEGVDSSDSIRSALARVDESQTWLQQPAGHLFAALLFGLAALAVWLLVARLGHDWIGYTLSLFGVLFLVPQSFWISGTRVRGEPFELALLAVFAWQWSRKLESRPWASALFLAALVLRELGPLLPAGDLLLALADTSFVIGVAWLVRVAGRRGEWRLRGAFAAAFLMVAGYSLIPLYLVAFGEFELATHLHTLLEEWSLWRIGAAAGSFLAIGLVTTRGRDLTAPRGMHGATLKAN